MKLFAYINGNLADKSKDISSIAPYIDIYYEEQNFNYNYGINSSRRRVPVKWCDQSDFGYDDEGISFFASWSNFAIVCPDWQNGTMFNYYNDGFY
jgi:hypothetical protein